jgi:hypothetical protein
MASTPNQKQVTTHNQIQSLSKHTKLISVNDMLRSFELEKYHEFLEEQEESTFDDFLQSTEFHWIVSNLLKAPFKNHCR